MQIVDRDPTLPLRLRMRYELRMMLERRRFDFFATLATNFASLTSGQMRSLLRQWDARCNRVLNQAHWQKRPDERIHWFAFPEKFETNPHWHLLIQLDPALATAPRPRQLRAQRFPLTARESWLRLIPSGSFDLQPITSAGAIDYATKVLDRPEHLESFIWSREFEHN